MKFGDDKQSRAVQIEFF